MTAAIELSSVVVPQSSDVPPPVTIALYGAYKLPTTYAVQHHAGVTGWRRGDAPADVLVVEYGDVPRAVGDMNKHLDAGHAVLVFSYAGGIPSTLVRQMHQWFGGQSAPEEEEPARLALYSFYRHAKADLQHVGYARGVLEEASENVMRTATELAYQMRPVTIASDQEGQPSVVPDHATVARADRVTGDVLVLSWEHVKQFRPAVQAYLDHGRSVGIYEPGGFDPADVATFLVSFGYAPSICNEMHCTGTTLTLYRDWPEEKVQLMGPMKPPETSGLNAYQFSLQMAAGLLRGKPLATSPNVG